MRMRVNVDAKGLPFGQRRRSSYCVVVPRVATARGGRLPPGRGPTPTPGRSSPGRAVKTPAEKLIKFLEWELGAT
jgi:hypothetical protein